MNLTLKIWRQSGSQDKGRMVEYKVTDISEHMSFLEMMDVLLITIVEKVFAEHAPCISTENLMVLTEVLQLASCI